MKKLNDKTICFEHLPRTGGGSVNSALRLYYGEDFSGFNEEASSEVIHGHRAFLKTKKFEKISYFTFLRHPKDHVISRFKHKASGLRSKHFKKIRKGVSLEEYLRKGYSKDLNNGIIRRISGMNFPYGECNEEIYQKTLKMIEKRFFFIGITELFDKSILGLSKVLNWETYPLYLRKHKSEEDEKIVQGDYEDLLLKYNKFDIRLYDFFRERFFKFQEENKDFYSNHLKKFKNTLKVFQNKERVLAEYRDRERFNLKGKIKKFFFKIPF